MNDEVAAPEVLADVPAPDQGETATPETVEAKAPEETTEAAQPEEKPKQFTQEELDAAIGKRLAREQRKWEREQAARIAEQAVKLPDNLNPEQFETAEQYAEALAQKKAIELVEQREQQRRQAQIADAYHDKEEEARNKYDDFEQVAYSPSLAVTDVMAHTIQASDMGPDIAYYLGSNPKEASRIANLAPFLQAKEIGRIEAKLSAEPPKPTKTSSAPAPISPVTPIATVPSYDTTDPRAIQSMSTSEWIEAERARQRRNLERARQR